MKKVILFCSLMVVLFSFSDETDEIGNVMAVEGTAKAGSRKLARGGSIFPREVIRVDPASKVQIRFTDGSVLNLKEKTEYKVNSYANNRAGKNEFSADLLKGGFETLSGSIAKENPAGFTIKTPNATIGLSEKAPTSGKTKLMANIVEGETYFGCEEGEISISNAAGERFLGANEYISSSSQNEMSYVTNMKPETFTEDYFITLEQANEEPVSSGETITATKESPKEEASYKAEGPGISAWAATSSIYYDESSSPDRQKVDINDIQNIWSGVSSSEARSPNAE